MQRHREKPRRAADIVCPLLAFFVALLTAAVAPAHTPTKLDPAYLIDTWTTEDGLPENSATAMVQDRNGYLWFGTFGGLVRFDGVSFTRFDSFNTPELPAEVIVNLFLDASGRLWVSTTKGLVTRDDAGWHAIDGWSGDYARTFSQRANGDLLITTFNGLLLESNQGRLRQLPLPPGTPGFGYFGHADEEGRWWVVRSDFVGYWDGKQWVRAPGLPSGADVCCDAGDGGMWLLERQSLLKFRQGKQVKRLELPGTPHGVWSLYEDRDGNVWITTMFEGLSRISPSGEFRNWNTVTGLGANATRFVFEDAERDLWIGTSGGGLGRFKRRRFKSIGASEGLPERVVRSVWPVADGSMLVGTYGGGVVRLRDGKTEALSLPGWNGAKIYVQSVLSDHAGRLWIGTLSQGLWIDESGVFRHVPAEQTGGANPQMLFEDSHGRVWMDGGAGIALYESQTFRVLEQHAPAPTCTMRFAEDAGGVIWAASREGVFQFQGGKLVAVREQGQPIRNVIAILGDQGGAVWIAPEHDDLLCYRAGKATRIVAGAGIPAGEIRGMIQDGDGFLWMTSPRGIFRIRRDELLAYADGKRTPLTVNRFNLEDGLPSLNFQFSTEPVCARDRQGRLWFATENGLARIDPKELRIDTSPPHVLIESLSYQKPSRKSGPVMVTPRGHDEDIVRISAPFTDPIHLPARSRWLEFEYAALSLAAPSKVRYQVKLEPVDTDWQEMENQRAVRYRDPGPGDYLFRVRATNSDGIWNLDAASVAFTLRQSFWQTNWFRIGVAVLLVGLGAAAAWWLARRRHRRELEAQRQLNELARLSRVSLLGEMSGSLAHELNQPLSAVLTNAQAAQRFLSSGQVDLGELKLILTDVIDDTKRAGEIIRRMRLLLEKGEVNQQRIDLNELVLDVLRLLRGNVLEQRVAVETDLQPDLPPVYGDRIQLQQVLLNLVINAAEAVAASAEDQRRVTIRTRLLYDSSVRLSVIDVGCGIPPDRMQRIFEPFFTTKEHGIGLGLAVCRTIVSAHGGNLSASNNLDRGATFHLTLPKHRNRIPPESGNRSDQ